MDVGNYTLEHLLGRGGTSEVYAAKHRERGTRVAVKRVQTPGVDLAAEAMRVRDIHHPNVVRIIEAGSDFLVMELVEGETLAARLSRGPLGESELRELGAAIADGMQAAHARGIVHRDLKPGNVMLRGDVPVIVDFGIAKSLGATSAAVTERRVGTVAYMAPEQLVDGLITPAVDIWALGVTLYEAATGALPFSSFQDGRLPQLFETAPRARTVSPGLAELIARCLERDPGKRPASMADIARSLRIDDGDRVTADLGSTAIAPATPLARMNSSTSRGTNTSPALKRRWPLFVALGSVGAIAVAVIATREPTKSTTPTATNAPTITIDAAVPAPVVESLPVATPVVEAPKSPTKRAKPRPKQRKTSQGETLD